MWRSVDLAAKYSHYREHLNPIWEALPDSVRGTDWGDYRRLYRDRLVLVAGYADIERSPQNQFIYVEHGAGQQYVNLDRGADAHYAGGNGHQHTVGFLCPNQSVVDRWLNRYPNKLAFAVGCPRLDAWHSGERGEPDPKTVAITFHWDGTFTGVEETKTTYWYFRDAVIDAVRRWTADGWTVLGHHHPRFPKLGQEWWLPEYIEAGVQPTPDVSEVMDRASILVADNTSLQAEFLSLGRKVVWMNHPSWVARQVQHGQRFWTWPERAGTQVSSTRELLELDLSSVPAATWHPYVDGDGRSLADGHASERAAQAVNLILGGGAELGRTS